MYVSVNCFETVKNNNFPSLLRLCPCVKCHTNTQSCALIYNEKNQSYKYPCQENVFFRHGYPHRASTPGKDVLPFFSLASSSSSSRGNHDAFRDHSRDVVPSVCMDLPQGISGTYPKHFPKGGVSKAAEPDGQATSPSRCSSHYFQGSAHRGTLI